MKKLLLKIAGLAALCVALAAGALEWTGYSPFDRKDGSNPVCELDSHCRPLTKGETALARGVFGDAIDYSKVKVFNRPYMVFFGRTTGEYVTPNGNIYSSGAKDDFSVASGGAKDIFIHEITHVWQQQSGRNVQGEAAVTLIKSHFDYKAAYHYDSSKNFKDMNLEQQAEAVENYFSLSDDFNVMGCDDLAKTTTQDYFCRFFQDQKTTLERQLQGSPVRLDPPSAPQA